LIYENDLEKLYAVDLKNRNLNFRASHPDTDLDDKITPLAAAAFLGRYEIVELLLENPMTDIDLATEDTGLTPLSSACAAGHYMIVRLLVENGADVNKTTGLDFSPLYY
jgi:ankyrin repeat protein